MDSFLIIVIIFLSLFNKEYQKKKSGLFNSLYKFYLLLIFIYIYSFNMTNFYISF